MGESVGVMKLPPDALNYQRNLPEPLEEMQMLHTSSISGQAVFPSPSEREETGQQDVPEHYPGEVKTNKLRYMWPHYRQCSKPSAL